MEFMIQKGKVPVEVKAEENLQAQSLKAYCKKFEPEYTVRFSMLDYTGSAGVDGEFAVVCG